MDIYFPPKSGLRWQAWGRNLTTVITPETAPEFGVNGGEFQALADAFAAFDRAFVRAIDPATRSTPNIADKDEKLDAFHRLASRVVGMLKVSPKVGARTLAELGIRDGTGGHGRPGPAPMIYPEMSAELSGPQSARVLAIDRQDRTRRAKPENVAKLEYRWHFGDDIGGGPAAWPLSRIAGRTRLDLDFPQLGQDATVWVSACYLNGSGERGPFGTPTSVRLPGSGAKPAAEGAKPGMKIAA